MNDSKRTEKTQESTQKLAPRFDSVELGKVYRDYLADIYGMGFDGSKLSVERTIKGHKIA